MAIHPALTKTQRDVLGTVRWQSRDERWSHITLCYLRSLGLVQSERLTAGRYCWSITELGIATRDAKIGTPVSGCLADMMAARR